MANKERIIKVERETYEKNGRTFYSYFIKGKIRGKEARIALAPPDIGGYTVLDIVFGNAMQAELVTKTWEMKDEKTGQVNTGMTFAVVSHDEDGTVFECAIKPAKKSDKDLLNMLLAR